MPELEYTPAARASLQRMPDANAASALAQRAQRVAQAKGRRIIGLEVLETAAIADDAALESLVNGEI